MLYNVGLYSNLTGQVVSKLKGLDGRVLKFTEYRYAETAAKDKNDFFNSVQAGDLKFIVVEDKGE